MTNINKVYSKEDSGVIQNTTECQSDQGVMCKNS